MEVDDFPSKLKPPSGDTASITSSSKKSKKKSAVAKLAERKRRSSGSEFGSSTSLQSNKADGDKTSPKESSGNDKSNNASYKRLEEPSSSKSNRGKSEKRTPVPVPRHKKTTTETSDWDPPPKLDEFHDDNSPPKNDDGSISKKAPSDATIHRFRALKMASDPSGSVESLKNLQFVPKPPETPKKEKTSPVANQKGEKRNREPHSSSDEQEVEAKASKKQSTSFIDLKSETLKYSKIESDTDDVFMKEKKEKAKMSDSETDLKAVSKEYEKVMSGGFNDSIMNSPGGKLTRAGQLPPVSPKNRPPPVGDISSQSLKTTIKTDAPTGLQRYFSDSVSSASRRSFSSSLMMCPITTQEARQRSVMSI